MSFLYLMRLIAAHLRPTKIVRMYAAGVRELQPRVILITPKVLATSATIRANTFGV
jgi:hypothetical protein